MRFRRGGFLIYDLQDGMLVSSAASAFVAAGTVAPGTGPLGARAAEFFSVARARA